MLSGDAGNSYCPFSWMSAILQYLINEVNTSYKIVKFYKAEYKPVTANSSMYGRLLVTTSELEMH